MRAFKFQKIDLEEIIRQEFATCGFPDSPRFTENALKEGRLLVLLDGLDEVPSDKIDEVIHHIQSFVDRHSSNRFITSCRTAFYKTYFPRFTDVVLTDFDLKQIEVFIRNWFRSHLDIEQKTADEFWAILQI